MSDHVCQECGCQCSSCVDKSSLNLHLHREIELLHYRTGLQTQHIHQMEASMMVSEPKNGEVAYLRDELQALQSKYDRLIESHRKIQKVNQNLEEKVLKIVDQCETEKSTLNNEVTILSGKLLDAKVTLCDLEDENERLRNDCSLAVQLLQCKPSNFVSQKLESLPSDLKHRIRSHMTHDQLRQYEHPSAAVAPPSLDDHRATIRVPVATFPPTAMVYSINKAPAATTTTTTGRLLDTDTVSPSIVAKMLEQKAGAAAAAHKTCRSWASFKVHSIECADAATQTDSQVARRVAATQTDGEGGRVPAAGVHAARTRRLSNHSSVETMII